MSYYVYLLTDPRNNNEVFYCGKGKSDRWKSHLGHWSGNGKNNPTENKIKRIQAEGLEPGVLFLHENIADEDLAYDLETAYIRENFDNLTNLKIDNRPPSALGKKGYWANKVRSKETKQKISTSLTGQKRGSYSEQHRKAISDSLKGDKHPNYGKPAKNRKPIIETTTGKVFESQLHAADLLNIKQSDINNVLKNRQKSTKGYVFKYLD